MSISSAGGFTSSGPRASVGKSRDRKSTRLNSSHDQISYAVFCLKKKKTTNFRNFHTPAPPRATAILCNHHGFAVVLTVPTFDLRRIAHLPLPRQLCSLHARSAVL